MSPHSPRRTRLLGVIPLVWMMMGHSTTATPTLAPYSAGTDGSSGYPAQGTSDLVAGPYSGPAVSVAMRSNAGVAETVVTVRFPTGGWELRADSSDVRDGAAVVRLTLVGPAPNEMVTQVLMERPWTLPNMEPHTRVEVWVNVLRRGASPQSPQYRLAARYPSKTNEGAAGESPSGVRTQGETVYRCGNERLRIGFEDGRAHVSVGGDSSVTLDRLKGDQASNQVQTFTNGRMTLVRDPDDAKAPQVRFARGRMAPVPCTPMK